MRNRDSLVDLFRIVIGREPKGYPISNEEIAAANQRLGAPPEWKKSSVPKLFIPELYFEFLRAFGSEESLVKTYFFMRSPESITSGLSHIVIAANPRAAFSFGIWHRMLQFDDPAVHVVPTGKIDDAVAWEDYCESLEDCLIQFACWNLCESMPYTLIIDDIRESRIREDITSFHTIALTESGENGIHYQPYYAPGTIIGIDVDESMAVLSFDTLERAIAFQTEHEWGYESILMEDGSHGYD